MTTSTDNELTANDVMTARFETVAPEDTLGEVAEKLGAANVGSVLVVEWGHLVGILTSRDIVRALVSRVHPSEARAREWMTSPAETAAPETPVADAAQTMIAGGFHHLPVVQAGRPVGVVGLRAATTALESPGLGF